jgi:hypothetical protein
MPVKQGDLELLQVPVSQELLQSKIPAGWRISRRTERRESFRSGSTGMDGSL